TSACSKPSGYVTTSGDCDDTKSSIHPGATEICDGIDQDCDGTADDGLTFTTYYKDSDGDTYGDSSISTIDCSKPSAYVTASGDSDDTKSSIPPGATAICDGIDQDCDGTADDGLTFSTYYYDSDKDGYGGSTTTSACSTPSGYVTTGGDCDDTDKAINPGA